MKNADNRIISVGIALFLILAFPAIGVAWVPGPSLDTARHGLDVVEHDGDIYAVGGWNGGTVLEVLYSGDTSWTTLTPLPVQQQGVAIALVGDEIYAMGSYGPHDTCQIYNITTGMWTAGPTLPQAQYWSTAESVGTNIYLIGGSSPGGAGVLDTLFILDTTTGIWSDGESMPGTMMIPGSAVYGNNIYVFDSNNRYYKYDISTDTWTTFTGPPSGHGHAAEAVTVDDRIYLIGGNTGNIYTAFTETEIFNPVTEEWISGPDLNVGRYQFGAVYVESEDRIYAVGGRDDSASSLDSVEILDFVDFTLTADQSSISAGSGGVVTFTISMGSENAGRKYILLGSITGTTPGVTLPDGKVLPITWDFYTDFMLSLMPSAVYTDFLGFLDASGGSTPVLDTLGPLPSQFIGITMYYAFAGGKILPDGWFASNSVEIDIVP